MSTVLHQFCHYLSHRVARNTPAMAIAPPHALHGSKATCVQKLSAVSNAQHCLLLISLLWPGCMKATEVHARTTEGWSSPWFSFSNTFLLLLVLRANFIIRWWREVPSHSLSLSYQSPPFTNIVVVTSEMFDLIDHLYTFAVYGLAILTSTFLTFSRDSVLSCT